MKKGTIVKIKYYPKCSNLCKESCSHCIVDTMGKATGRQWTPSVGAGLFEVKYKKQGTKKHIAGVFSEKELEIINT